MANERLYLACTYCIHHPDTTCLFYFAKYYPSTGWYTTAPETNFQEKLDEWFAQHKHGTLHGQFVTLFGTDINPMMRSSAEVLKMLGSYLARAQMDDPPTSESHPPDTSKEHADGSDTGRPNKSDD